LLSQRTLCTPLMRLASIQSRGLNEVKKWDASCRDVRLTEG
jgi:hypothetical protein